jgi:hypothetical protein
MYSRKFPILSLDQRDVGAKWGDVGSIPLSRGKWTGMLLSVVGGVDEVADRA